VLFKGQAQVLYEAAIATEDSTEGDWWNKTKTRRGDAAVGLNIEFLEHM
jgi:hypothetical protein